MKIEHKILDVLKDIKPIVKLHELGDVFLVGGLVRDHFLEKESKDIDLLVCGVPIEVIKATLSPFGSVDEVGDSFGVIKFKPKGWQFDEPIDIAIPRTEKKVGDGHKGFEIEASHDIPLETDLMRRDFTINAMVISLDGDLIDPFDGLDDLRGKKIKMVNSDAFKEDPLRMMRAIQFASRFGFRIGTLTWKAILDNASSITQISGERILGELDKIFHKGNCNLGIFLFEASTLKFRIFGHDPMPLMVERDHNTRGDFFINMGISPEEFSVILKGDTKTKKLMEAIVEVTTKIAPLGKANRGAWRIILADARKISNDVIRSMVVQKYCGSIMMDFNTMTLPWSIKDLEINGDDLIMMGHKGAAIGKILRTVFEAVLNEEIDNRKRDIIEFISSLEV